jgi:hypothetical protein
MEHHNTTIILIFDHEETSPPIQHVDMNTILTNHQGPFNTITRWNGQIIYTSMKPIYLHHMHPQP